MRRSRHRSLQPSALLAPAAARAGVNPQIAGLQVALRAHGLYLSQIDGIAGPKHGRGRARVPAQEASADRRCRHPDPHRARPARRPALRLAHAPSRRLRLGRLRAAVPADQRGVYSGALDGYLGKETAAALRRYQRSMHLSADAVVGPRTLTAIVARTTRCRRARRPRRSSCRSTSCAGRHADGDRREPRDDDRRDRSHESHRSRSRS